MPKKPVLTERKSKIEVLSSKTAFEGPLFRVDVDQVREPGNRISRRDVIRHNGSVVILAVDDASKKDPLIVMERQYRHAAGQYMWEIPAGKIEDGENRLAAAKRELREETGYSAKKWTKLTRYIPSPGFLGEWMQIFLAEGLTLGNTSPDEDEWLEVAMAPLSEILGKIEEGKVLDGKTLIAVLLFTHLRKKRKR
ncbi:MAG TPA: NUDIX hydrolase [Alloacidobacterium sp.]|jgi:ADP-ribose pyrophosphatase|nr:NUDIX hydrolase [Alloacidobacterium sp.]